MLSCIYTCAIFAQNHSCGSDLANFDKLENNLILSDRNQEIEEIIYKKSISYYNSAAPQKSVTDNTIYNIPVAFHVVYKTTDQLGTRSNLTDAQIQNSIDYLNNAFANSNYAYNSNGVNVNIQFCLKAVSRQASNDLSDICYHTEDMEMKSVNGLDPFKYLNIWSVNSVVFHKKDSNGNVISPCSVSNFGYTFRSYNHGNPNDGVVIEATSLLNSTFAHEVGHYFDLYHTYETTNSNEPCRNTNCFVDGDRVCDTPPDTTIIRTNCSMNEQFNSCSTDADDPSNNNPFSYDVNDMTDNYMDSNHAYCRFRFTEGKRIRMRTTLLYTRSSLLQINVIANFHSNTTNNPRISFTNQSINADSYYWDFGDGNTSVNSNPTHTYSSNGPKTVCLTAINNSLCNSMDKYCFDITIAGTGAATTEDCKTHYANSFETATNWQNLYNDDLNWIQQSGSTPSNFTGPASANDGSNYLFIESSSPNFGGKNAKVSVFSETISNQINSIDLSFDFHMYGSGMGLLKLFLYENENYNNPILLWNQSGNQGNNWINQTVNLDAFIGKNIELVFEGITGTNYSSDIAIDGIIITSCSNTNEEVSNENGCSSLFSEGFENPNNSYNVYEDDLDWIRKSGATPSNFTGPDIAIEGSYYMYVEASGNNHPNKKAVLSFYKNHLENSLTDVNFSFDYNMYGYQMGSLKLIAIVNENTTNPIPLWSQSGNNGVAWKQQTINLNNFIGSHLELRFEGQTGQGYTSDIDIDKLNIIACSNATPTNACSTTQSIPYVESFENNIGAWTQDTNDDLDWTIHSGTTPSNSTGPNSAFTGNYYLYVEASGNAGKEASITSPCFDLTTTQTPVFFLKRNMEGNSMGTLFIDFYGNGQWYNDAMTVSSTTNSVGEWGTIGGTIYDLEPNMQNCTDCKIRIHAKVGQSYQSDIAIDKFEVFDASAGNRLEETDLSVAFNDFTIFPNPANDKISLTFEKQEQIKQVYISNILGQNIPVAFQAADSKSINIDISDFAPGYYVVSVFYNFGKVKSKKLVVR